MKGPRIVDARPFAVRIKKSLPGGEAFALKGAYYLMPLAES